MNKMTLNNRLLFLFYGKNEEDNLREIEESPLLVDEGEGSGLYGEKIKHNIQEVHHLHSERNSNGSEYGKMLSF